MNSTSPDNLSTLAQSIVRLESQFALAFAGIEAVASRRLDQIRVNQMRIKVGSVVPIALQHPEGLLSLARAAQSAVPVTPTRRRLNEYFAIFTDSVEPGFLAPPPLHQSLAPAQKLELQRQVQERQVALEAQIAAEPLALRRAHYLQEANENALTISHGADPTIRALELRLTASYIEASHWLPALAHLQSMSQRFGPVVRQDDDSPAICDALRTIAGAQASLSRLMQQAVAAGDPHLSALQAADLQTTLQNLSHSILPPPAVTQTATRDNASLFDFTALRRQVAQLPLGDSLRSRVESELQIFDTSSRDQQSISGIMLERLAKLPPLRAIQPSESPAVNTPQQRNALRMSLRREFSALVVGHNDVREKLIEYIVSTLEQRGAKGWTIFLSGSSGIGKNTIAKAIARALNRELHEVKCSANTTSEEILGSLKVFQGSEPGAAASILMKQSRPAVIHWDEIGKPLNSSLQNVLNTILDNDSNAKVRDKYFATVDLDFSTAIHVASFNTEEKVIGSLLRRGAHYPLENLCFADKEEIARRVSRKCIEETFGSQSSITMPNSILHLMLERRDNEPGVGQLPAEIKQVVWHARRVQDGGQSLNTISPEVSMELLDGARATTRLVGTSDELAYISELTASKKHRPNEQDKEYTTPSQLIWHIFAGNKQWRVSVREEGCSIRLLDDTPFFGAFGISVLNEYDEVQSLFIDPKPRRFNNQVCLNLPSVGFVDSRGHSQTTALNGMRLDPRNKKILFSVRLLSPHLSHQQVLRILRNDLGVTQC